MPTKVEVFTTRQPGPRRNWGLPFSLTSSFFSSDRAGYTYPCSAARNASATQRCRRPASHPSRPLRAARQASYAHGATLFVLLQPSPPRTRLRPGVLPVDVLSVTLEGQDTSIPIRLPGFPTAVLPITVLPGPII